MSEQEWLDSTDPTPMLDFLRGKASGRKLRLFACACCRRVWPLLVERQSREAVEVAEQYADGTASDDNLASARAAALRTYLTSPPGTASYRAAAAAFYATRGPVRLAAGNAAAATAGLVPAFGGQEQADLLRCLLGHLFARAAVDHDQLAEDLAWTAVGERELLAVPRDLGDLHAAAVDEIDGLSGVSRKIDHLAASNFFELDALDQLVDRVVRDVLEQRDFLDVPERSLLVLRHNVVSLTNGRVLRNQYCKQRNSLEC